MAQLIQKKICMLGAYQVGKTSLVKQFVSSIYSDKYLPTLGVKVDKKMVSLDGRDVMLMLWDIAGAEDHFTVPTSFVRGAAGYLLVVDGTRPETAERGLDLVAQMDGELGRLPAIILLNKSDLTDQWRLDDAAIAKLTALNVPVMRSSAKTGQNVEAAFRQLAELSLRGQG